MPRQHSVEFKEKAAYQMRVSDSLCAGVGLQGISQPVEISHGHLVDRLFPSDGFHSSN